jgi:hypothetical protein
MLIFAGFICPTVILAAYEEHSKCSFLVGRGGTPLYFQSKILIGYSYLLFPFLAAITFEIVVLAVEWLT